ncbi:hypothetical protein GXM_08377 [Nostoc sphaeroides CCNUC1]|uniref:Uncharacterized protein n=1 Tax=Nostoc sphaeroides CCNUC1 TaxID=2653204 RepID=A0A5P8WDI3_9NOSO|nr:hypothetical protein GXM_08377 [Nostoc sphaeroides CCNUC1]
MVERISSCAMMRMNILKFIPQTFAEVGVFYSLVTYTFASVIALE